MTGPIGRLGDRLLERFIPSVPTYISALELISAALVIHHPCHHAATPAWECEVGHYGDYGLVGGFDGTPDASQPAVCVSCTYDDRTVIYPCPTALALGVQPPEGEPHP